MITFLKHSRFSEDIADELCKKVHRLRTTDVLGSIRLPLIERCVIDDSKARMGWSVGGICDPSIHTYEIGTRTVMISLKEPTTILYCNDKVLIEFEKSHNAFSIIRHFVGKCGMQSTSFGNARPWSKEEARRLLDFMSTPWDLPDLTDDLEEVEYVPRVGPVMSTNHYVVDNV